MTLPRVAALRLRIPLHPTLAGSSYRTISEVTAIPHATIFKQVSGRTNLTADVIAAISLALGLPIDSFVEVVRVGELPATLATGGPIDPPSGQLTPPNLSAGSGYVIPPSKSATASSIGTAARLALTKLSADADSPVHLALHTGTPLPLPLSGPLTIVKPFPGKHANGRPIRPTTATLGPWDERPRPADADPMAPFTDYDPEPRVTAKTDDAAQVAWEQWEYRRLTGVPMAASLIGMHGLPAWRTRIATQRAVAELGATDEAFEVARMAASNGYAGHTALKATLTGKEHRALLAARQGAILAELASGIKPADVQPVAGWLDALGHMSALNTGKGKKAKKGKKGLT